MKNVIRITLITLALGSLSAPASAAYPWLDISRWFAIEQHSPIVKQHPAPLEAVDWVPGPAPAFVEQLAGGNYWTGGCKVWDWIPNQLRNRFFFRV